MREREEEMRSGAEWRVRFRGILRIPLIAAAAVVSALAVAAVAIWWGGLNQDEGWYLYAAKMVYEGEMPYRDFFFTQGPAMPFVYGWFSPLWGSAGILGGRIFTCVAGMLGAIVAAVFAMQLVQEGERRAAAFWTAFALLACNVYHVYFTTIPKTYALGALFLAAGFAVFAAAEKKRIGAYWLLAGLLMAFASGTRISLALAPFACGCALLATCKRRGLAFVWFGAGAAAGCFLTYGVFALDGQALEGLLEAQKYHAGRGGFDFAFVVGSLSRLARGYIAVAGVVVLAWLAGWPKERGGGNFVAWTAAVACGAVMLLQLSAPFPYDDYQVPVMPIVVGVVAAFAARRMGGKAAAAAVALTLAASFSAPMLQEWATCGQDRFWSVKREKSALAQLRDVARRIEAIDPGGEEILTQDLYLAVETRRKVPRGFEMGPFSYFPQMDTAKALRINVLNKSILADILANADAGVAAGSGYAFAIEVPTCAEVPFADQMEFWEELKKRYELAFRENAFGQNNTPLVVLKRKGEEAGDGQTP